MPLFSRKRDGKKGSSSSTPPASPGRRGEGHAGARVENRTPKVEERGDGGLFAGMSFTSPATSGGGGDAVDSDSARPARDASTTPPSEPDASPPGPSAFSFINDRRPAGAAAPPPVPPRLGSSRSKDCDKSGAERDVGDDDVPSAFDFVRESQAPGESVGDELVDLSPEHEAPPPAWTGDELAGLDLSAPAPAPVSAPVPESPSISVGMVVEVESASSGGSGVDSESTARVRALVSTPRKKKRTVRRPGYGRGGSGESHPAVLNESVMADGPGPKLSSVSVSEATDQRSGVESRTQERDDSALADSMAVDAPIDEAAPSEERNGSDVEPMAPQDEDEDAPPPFEDPAEAPAARRFDEAEKDVFDALKAIRHDESHRGGVSEPEQQDSDKASPNPAERASEDAKPGPSSASSTSFLETSERDDPAKTRARPEKKGDQLSVFDEIRVIKEGFETERVAIQTRQRALRGCISESRQERLNALRALVKVRQEEKKTEFQQAEAIEADNFSHAQALDDTLSSLRSRRAASALKASQVAGRLETLESQYSDLQQSLCHIAEDRVGRLQAIRDKRAGRIEEAARVRKAELDADLEQIEEELEAAERSLSHVALDRQMCETAIGAIVSQVRGQTAQEQSELATLQSRVAQLDSDITELERSLAAKVSLRERAATQIADIQSRVATVESKFVKERTRLDRALAAAEKQNRELERIQLRAEERRREISREKVRLADAPELNSPEIKALDGELVSLQERSTTFGRRRTALLTVIEEHRRVGARQAEQEQEVFRLREATCSCSVEVADLQAHVTSAAAQVSEAKIQLAHVAAALPGLNADKQRSVSGRNFREAQRVAVEIKGMTAKQKDLETLLRSTESQLDADRARLQALEKELDGRQQREEIAQTKLELEIVESLRQRRREARRELKAFVGRVQGPVDGSGDTQSGDEDSDFEDRLRLEIQGCSSVIGTLAPEAKDSDESGESDVEPAHMVEHDSFDQDSGDQVRLPEEPEEPEEPEKPEADSVDDVACQREMIVAAMADVRGRIDGLEKSLEQAVELEKFDQCETIDGEIGSLKEELEAFARRLAILPAAREDEEPGTRRVDELRDDVVGTLVDVSCAGTVETSELGEGEDDNAGDDDYDEGGGEVETDAPVEVETDAPVELEGEEDETPGGVLEVGEASP